MKDSLLKRIFGGLLAAMFALAAAGCVGPVIDDEGPIGDGDDDVEEVEENDGEGDDDVVVIVIEGDNDDDGEVLAPPA